jgi:hypothetical protein
MRFSMRGTLSALTGGDRVKVVSAGNPAEGDVTLSRVAEFVDPPVGADSPSGLTDPMVVGISAVNVTIAVPSNNAGRMVRWTAPRTTRVVGFICRVANQSGNIEASILSDRMVKLGGTGPIACPSASSNRYLTFPSGVQVEAGRSYWLLLAADTTVASFGGFSGYLYGGRPLVSQVTGVYPTPARINPEAQGVNTHSGTAGFQLVPVTEPARVRRVASDLTVNMGEIIGCDRTSSRIFGRVGSATLAWSDDAGATVTTGAAFTGETVRAVAAAGSYLFVATQVNADSTGRIRRAPRNGPYGASDFTLVLDNQEGYCVPWCFVAYDDGVVFAGNYTAPNAAEVRMRRSTDWGATWSVVLDLGPGGVGTNAQHIHSVMRDPVVTSRVYCNVGDHPPDGGVYMSDDGGASFTREPSFGAIRLTPLVPYDGGAVWGSDQFGRGANLFFQDPVANTLEPRGIVDSPWIGDVYGMDIDDRDWVWLFNRGTGTNGNQRATILMTPDGGDTMYLIADLGAVINPALTLLRVDDYLFHGNLRYDVSGVEL